MTMLQRSPTYIVARPAGRWAADWLTPQAAATDRAPAHPLEERAPGDVLLQPRAAKARRRSNKRSCARARTARPRLRCRKALLAPLQPVGPARCLVPDGDLFVAIRAGKVSVVTDEIETFTEKGLRLRCSRRDLETDIVVTATGLVMRLMGGADIVVDGRPVDIGKTLTYKGRPESRTWPQPLATQTPPGR